ncbi:MAG: sterol desaturase family protein [Verrucomicrobia bacterium]|nr:sterol desaturase family protein [Prolixibacteraceae bacterium]
METLNKLIAIDPVYIQSGLVFLFFIMEQFIATQYSFLKRSQHFFHNFLLFVTFVLINFFAATVVVNCFTWLNEHRIGLFFYVKIPYILQLILGVLLIDLAAYFFHRFTHKNKLLWRFHRVHHSDTRMDASTQFRSHPVDVFYFTSAGILASAIFGLDLIGFGLYFLVLLPMLVLQHATIHTPAWVDKSFGLIFTTPNLHKIHHEQNQFYTDSNFADLFILWDRIFGTYKFKPVNEIKLGLMEFDEDGKQKFWYLLKSPFISMNRINTNT